MIFRILHDFYVFLLVKERGNVQMTVYVLGHTTFSQFFLQNHLKFFFTKLERHEVQMFSGVFRPGLLRGGSRAV